MSKKDFSTAFDTAHKESALKEFKLRFTREYLTALLERHQYDHRESKTFQQTIKVGMVVQMQSEVKGHGPKKLAVVTDLHPVSDNIVRSVGLRTANGMTKCFRQQEVKAPVSIQEHHQKCIAARKT